MLMNEPSSGRYIPTPLPSTFQIAELPLYIAKKNFDNTYQIWKKETLIQPTSLLVLSTLFLKAFVERSQIKSILESKSFSKFYFYLGIFSLGVQYYPILSNSKTLAKEVSSLYARGPLISTQTVIKAMALILRLIASQIIGMVALPLTACLTPVTMISDIILGILEGLYHTYHQADGQAIQKLLYQKIVVAPIHQGLFIAKFVSYFYERLFLIHTNLFRAIAQRDLSEFITAFYNKTTKKFLFDKLKNSVNYNQDWHLEYDTSRSTLSSIKVAGIAAFFDNIASYEIDHSADIVFLNSHMDIITPEVGDGTSSWEEYLDTEIPSLPTEKSQNCENFRAQIISRRLPMKIFSDPDSLIKVKAEFRKLARKVHPDHNENNKESNILFKALQKAREIVESQLNEDSATRQDSHKAAYAFEFCRRSFRQISRLLCLIRPLT